MNDRFPLCFTETTQTPNANTIDSLAVDAFSAINWPTDRKGARGLPDQEAPLPTVVDYATVWEGWRSRTDIFRPDGQAPMGWDAPDPWLPTACQGVTLTDAQRTAFAWAQVPDSPFPPHLLSGYQNPQGEVLIDASGQPVRYQILFNRQAHDYVLDNRLWSLPDLADFVSKNGGLQFPQGTGAKRGAIIIKAAWKILDPDQPKDMPDRLHKAWAYVTPLVRDGKPVEGCAILPVGLIGLHIMLKVDAFPGWLWSTFENAALAPTWDQLDDLPDDSGGDRTRGWLFFEDAVICEALGDCQAFTALNDPPALTTVAETLDPAFPPNPSRIVVHQPPGYYRDTFSGPCVPEDQSFACLNDGLQARFKGTALGNYVFKGTQWLDGIALAQDRSQNDLAHLKPEILANAAMESFNQPGSNCYACHKGAGSPGPGFANYVPNPRRAIFDFIFSFQRIRGMPASGNLP